MDINDDYKISEKLSSFNLVIIENIQDTTCFAICELNNRCKCLSISIHPCISCLKPQKVKLREYLEEMNNMFYSGHLLLDSNGAMYIQISQNSIDAPLSIETISFIFSELHSVLENSLQEIKK